MKMEVVVEGLEEEDDDRSLDEKLREFLHMAAAAVARGRIWDLTEVDNQRFNGGGRNYY